MILALKFRPYLLSDKFTLFTDHKAIHYVFNNLDPRERIARWTCLLAEYDFVIQYYPGSENSPADYPSRQPQDSNLVLTLQV